MLVVDGAGKVVGEIDVPDAFLHRVDFVLIDGLNRETRHMPIKLYETQHGNAVYAIDASGWTADGLRRIRGFRPAD